MKRYLLNLLIAFDQWFNALFGGAPDDTISASAAMNYRKGGLRGRIICGVLNWLDPGHCEAAIKSEQEHSQQSPGLR